MIFYTSTPSLPWTYSKLLLNMPHFHSVGKYDCCNSRKGFDEFGAYSAPNSLEPFLELQQSLEYEIISLALKVLNVLIATSDKNTHLQKSENVPGSPPAPILASSGDCLQAS